MRKILICFIFITILTACTAMQPQPATPTQVLPPTLSPTATQITTNNVFEGEEIQGEIIGDATWMSGTEVVYSRAYWEYASDLATAVGIKGTAKDRTEFELIVGLDDEGRPFVFNNSSVEKTGWKWEMVFTQDEGEVIYWYWLDENGEGHPVLGYHENEQEGLTAFWPMVWGKGGAQLVVTLPEDAQSTMPERMNAIMSTPAGVKLVSVSELKKSDENSSSDQEPNSGEEAKPEYTVEDVERLLNDPENRVYYSSETEKKTIPLETGWTNLEDLNWTFHSRTYSEALSDYMEFGHFSGILLDFSIEDLRSSTGGRVVYPNINIPAQVIKLKMGVKNSTGQSSIIELNLLGGTGWNSETEQPFIMQGTIINTLGGQQVFFNNQEQSVDSVHTLSTGNKRQVAPMEEEMEVNHMKFPPLTTRLESLINKQIVFEAEIPRTDVDLSEVRTAYGEVFKSQTDRLGDYWLKPILRDLDITFDLIKKNPITTQQIKDREFELAGDLPITIIQGNFYIPLDPLNTP